MKSRLFTSLFVVFASVLAVYANDSFSLKPEIHGVIRARAEMETADGMYRFQVRNARLSVSGKVAPPISYFVQFDACDKGKMKFLDAWGQFKLSKKAAFQAGQFRQPFGVDNFRGPDNYVFANTSFIGKYVNNYRGVGAKVSYNLVNALSLEAGLFNPTSIADHDIWTKKPAFASKIVAKAGKVSFVTGFQSTRPATVRMNFYDAAVVWKTKRWNVEAEYTPVIYTAHAAKTCHSYLFFISKSFKVDWGIFNEASLQTRFDGATDYSNGTPNENEVLIVNNPARNRITVGGTITYTYKQVHADIRLNYEKYFYHHGVEAPVGLGDKVLAELIIKF